MTTWTRQGLETVFPEGSVGVQVDDNFIPYTHEEWDTWIEQQVGTEKPEETDIPS